MPPSFLTLEEVLKIHRDQIERHGGPSGIRDTKVLRSALAMPHAGAGGEYCHGDLFETAAAYLFHLVQNHAFIDGNKRVGAAAAIVFLDLNGIEITAGDDDLVDLVLGVAAGQVSKSEVADFLRRCAPDAQVPVEPSDGCAVAGARGLPLRLPVLACVNLRQMRPRESER